MFKSKHAEADRTALAAAADGTRTRIGNTHQVRRTDGTVGTYRSTVRGYQKIHDTAERQS